MAQLWGGRFTKETDQLVYNFNASLGLTRSFINKILPEVWPMLPCWQSRGSLRKKKKKKSWMD